MAIPAALLMLWPSHKRRSAGSTPAASAEETSMQKILFLDVDGVLNNLAELKAQGRNAIGEEQLDLLKKIIERTNCEIVVSSSWRQLPKALKVLEAKLESRGLKIKGQTPQLPSDDVERKEEIKAWLDQNEVEKFAILDDSLDANIEGNFFKCEFKTGLTSEITRRVIEHLN